MSRLKDVDNGVALICWVSIFLTKVEPKGFKALRKTLPVQMRKCLVFFPSVDRSV